MGIKLDLEPAHVDFIVNRMRAGSMNWNESQAIAVITNIIQQQANNPKMQGKLIKSPPVLAKVPGPTDAPTNPVADAAVAAIEGEGNDQSQSAA